MNYSKTQKNLKEKQKKANKVLKQIQDILNENDLALVPITQIQGNRIAQDIQIIPKHKESPILTK